MVTAEVQRLVQSGLLWFSLVQHPGLSLMTSTMMHMCPLTCNYDWPRKGPIAIVRSAARRGADRTARARCVQQTNINSLSFCLPGNVAMKAPAVAGTEPASIYIIESNCGTRVMA